MIPIGTIPDRLQRAFAPTQRGVVGLTEQLLAVCVGEDVELERVGDGCVCRWTENGAAQEAPIPLPPSAFRTVLARVAALCNERLPEAVSPYGGEGQLVVGGTEVFVRFVNTTGLQRLAVNGTPPQATVRRPAAATEGVAVAGAKSP